MGEEAFDETRFVTDNGTIIIRGGYGRSSIWIGLSPGQNHDDDPDIVLKAGPALQRRIAAAILEMGNDITDDGFHGEEEAEHYTDLGFDPTWTVHPGATIADFMEEQGFNVDVFAGKLGISPTGLKEILKGQNPITPQLANMLERETGASADFWVNRERNFREDLKAQKKWVKRRTEEHEPSDG
jgi:addiction module HigA family antidote